MQDRTSRPPGTIQIRYLFGTGSTLHGPSVQNCARNVLTRFRERNDRARGEALDLMETRQLLAAGDKVRFRDDGIAAVDGLRPVPNHLHRDRSRHPRALKVSHRTPSQVMRHDAGHADLAAGRSPCAIEVLDRISLLTEEDRPGNGTPGTGEGFGF